MAAKSNVSGVDDHVGSTNKLLRVIIALLLRQGQDGPPSVKQQIETLSDLGLRPSEIAAILGRSSTHVNKELTGIRKVKKKG
jgi:hypothetical protein